MARERIVTPQEQEEEQEVSWGLRPRSLDECIGQQEIIESLRVEITAAKQRKEPLDHVLFHGPPGLGKTTMAHIISEEMGVEVNATSGPALERPSDIMGFLVNLSRGDILFIDEIHRIPRPVEEFLYTAMEDFKVNFTLDKGVYTKPLPFKLDHFTLIGATTRAGMLTAPLRERFGIRLHFDFYDDPDLKRIVERSAGILKVPVDEEGAFEIARRSRGTPRIANRFLRRTQSFAEVKADGKVTRQVADDALRLLRVDEKGLDKLDHALLKTIIEVYNGGPVGIEALGATLNEEVDTLIDMVEPFLLKIGFLARTSAGRRATPSAYDHLGYASPANLFSGQSLASPTLKLE
ncbi:MAG: Holliday junction branch migration DNA helicase RuvB [Armatimonadetes bacterium]|nr:Holliday junction branch migration DNA helicase RuvB [Armatimonadota bacterium]